MFPTDGPPYILTHASSLLACFNVCTGDIEDAPGTAPIHSFKAFVENGQIQVTADPASAKPENRSRPPKVITTAEEPGPGVVVVGGGSGAYGVVESLREFGYKKSITIISSEPYAPIDRLVLFRQGTSKL